MTTKRVYAIHEHNLSTKADKAAISNALRTLRVPGLLHAYHLKGFKGSRQGSYAVLWVFESQEAIVRSFGTPQQPTWPEDWLHYEHEILAPFLDGHPDKITFSDYEAIAEMSF